MNAGKTTTSVGLFSLFRSLGYRVGFIKPVGQSYVEIDELTVDKDSLLMKVVFDMPDDLQWMSPVVIPSGFTTEYVKNRDKYGHLRDDIVRGYETVARDKDIVIVEGTGHAGVGAIIGLSNAIVAKAIGASVMIVAEGGIGSAIDEIVLNAALFEKEGVEIMGVIVNKVLESKYAKIREVVSDDLRYKGFHPLGFLPFKAVLSYPNVHQIRKRVSAEVLCSGGDMNEYVENVVIADMEPQNMISRLTKRSLVITPGDRVDNILVAISSHLMGQDTDLKVSALLLTGGMSPHPSILNLLQRTSIPVLVAQDDTYNVASKVVSLTVKTQASDLNKIDLIKSLYAEHVDRSALLAQLGL